MHCEYNVVEDKLSDSSTLYTVFHKKGTPFWFFFMIYSNDDQFTQNFYQL